MMHLLFCLFSFFVSFFNSFSLVFGVRFTTLSDCVDDSTPNNCYLRDEDHFSCFHKPGDPNPRCSLGFFQGQGWQRECTCVSDCNFASEVLANKVSQCGINKLNGIDHEIGTQMAVNVIGAIGGNIPGIGSFFDIGFALWEPVGIVTSSFQLSDDIRDEINKAVLQLTQCIDEKIASALITKTIDDAQDQLRGITAQFADTVGASGDIKINRIEFTFLLFTNIIIEIFGDSSVTMMSRNVAEFEGLLAVYQAIYPLYSIVSAERLNYLKYHLRDAINFVNAFNVVMRNFETMETWIDEAHKAITDHPRRVFINWECRNRDAMHVELSAWDLDFENIYISNLKENIAVMQQIHDATFPFVVKFDLLASWKRVDSVSEFVTGVSGVSESELTFGFATNAMNFFNDNNNEMAFGNVNIVKNEVKAITSVLLHVGVLEKKYAPNEAVPRNSDPCGFISDYYNLAPFVNPTLYQYVVSFTAPAPSPASSESTDKSFEVYTGDWVCVEEGMTPPQCPLGFTVGVTSHKIYYQNCIPYQA